MSAMNFFQLTYIYGHIFSVPQTAKEMVDMSERLVDKGNEMLDDIELQVCTVVAGQNHTT